MCTRNQAEEILHSVYDACRPIFGRIHDAYLYGSYARGDFTSESLSVRTSNKTEIISDIRVSKIPVLIYRRRNSEMIPLWCFMSISSKASTARIAWKTA